MSGHTDVLRRASFETGVPVSALLGPSRMWRHVRIRFAVYWLLHIALRLRSVTIGEQLDRDPSVVRSGIRRAEELRDRDPAFRILTDKLLAEFEGQG